MSLERPAVLVEKRLQPAQEVAFAAFHLLDPLLE